MKRKRNLNKNKGYSLVELMLSLIVVGTISLISYQIIENKSQTSKAENALDIIKSQETNLTKFLNDNHDKLFLDLEAHNHKLVLPLTNLSSLSGGEETRDDNYSTSFYPSLYGTPCLILTSDSSLNNNKVNAYLLYPHKNDKDQVFSNKIVDKMGQIKNYLYNVNTTSSIIAPYLLDIQNQCGITRVNENSIFIDLTKNGKNTNKIIVDTTNSKKDLNSKSGALTNTGATNDKTMNTNLYLDVKYKDAESTHNYYCDASSIQSNNVTRIEQMSQSYATSNGLIYQGGSRVSSAVLSGSNCVATIEGNFSNLSCNEVDGLSLATAGCQNNVPSSGFEFIGNVNYISGSPTPVNGQCNGTYSAMYSIDTYHVTLIYKACQGGMNTCYNDKVDSDMAGVRKNSYFSSINKVWDSNPCTPNSYCGASLVGGGNKNFKIDQYQYIPAPNRETVFYSEYKDGTLFQTSNCPTVTWQAGAGPSRTITLPTQLTVPASEATNNTPAQHQYQSVVFDGNNSRGKVSLRTTTANGTANQVDTSVKVANAGVKSGYVMLKSKYVATDTLCSPELLGRMIQQPDQNNLYTRSILVCTYDPSFCNGTGYCYSPVKSQSLVVQSPAGQSSVQCPAGLRVDTSYVSNMSVNNGLLNLPSCASSYNGGSLTSPTTGERELLLDGGHYYGVVSKCKYNNGSYVLLSNISKLNCVSAPNKKDKQNCVSDGNGGITCSN